MIPKAENYSEAPQCPIKFCFASTRAVFYQQVLENPEFTPQRVAFHRHKPNWNGTCWVVGVGVVLFGAFFRGTCSCKMNTPVKYYYTCYNYYFIKYIRRCNSALYRPTFICLSQFWYDKMTKNWTGSNIPKQNKVQL